LTQFLAFVLHAALLVLMAGGIHRKPLAWAAAGTLLLLPNAGLTGKVLAVLALVAAEIVDLPTFVVLAVIYRTSALILTLLLCQVAAKTAVLAVAEFASVFLDWRNDRWMRSLARQLEMGAAADRRPEAAQKLLHLAEQLPIWVRPAKAALAAVLMDPDERVQQTAEATLKQLR
jgi:hypothetical protein